MIDRQEPVEEIRVVLVGSIALHILKAFVDYTRYTGWVIENDFVSLLCFFSERCTDKFVEPFELRFATFRAGENKWQLHVSIVRIQ